MPFVVATFMPAAKGSARTPLGPMLVLVEEGNCIELVCNIKELQWNLIVKLVLYCLKDKVPE